MVNQPPVEPKKFDVHTAAFGGVREEDGNLKVRLRMALPDGDPNARHHVEQTSALTHINTERSHYSVGPENRRNQNDPYIIPLEIVVKKGVRDDSIFEYPSIRALLFSAEYPRGEEIYTGPVRGISTKNGSVYQPTLADADDGLRR